MVILRATRKLRSLLPASEGIPPGTDTALGDWYVNRLVIDRQPLLLLVSSASLLSLFCPAREVRSLPDRLSAMVRGRLARCGLPEYVVEAETNAMATVAIGTTLDRSVVGIMVEFAKMIPHDSYQGGATLPLIEDWLAEIPCHASRPSDGVVFPGEKAAELLRSKWLSGAEPSSCRGV